MVTVADVLADVVMATVADVVMMAAATVLVMLASVSVVVMIVTVLTVTTVVAVTTMTIVADNLSVDRRISKYSKKASPSEKPFFCAVKFPFFICRAAVSRAIEESMGAGRRCSLGTLLRIFRYRLDFFCAILRHSVPRRCLLSARRVPLGDSQN